MGRRLVVIGNGMAGGKLLEELAQACPGKYDITVFGNEPYGNYNRIMLSPLLAGDKTLDDIMLNGREWYAANGFNLQAGADKAVVAINRGRKTVQCADGSETPYDKLVIATGSNPYFLPVEGNDLQGVMGFRAITDVNRMLSAVGEGKNAVVIGGGLLGLEAAVGLAGRGMQVTVVHHNATLLNRQLDAYAANLLEENLRSRGIHFKKPADTAKLSGSNGKLEHIHFADGSSQPADLVIMALGIRPNIRLAQEAGLFCKSGIVVSDSLQSYDPSIYALGECIEHRGATFGLVAPLYDQAKVLANHLSEHGVAQYKTLPTATKLKVTGIHLFSVGNFSGTDSSENLIYKDPANAIYKKLVIDNNRLIGAVAYGDTSEGSFYSELVESARDISDLRPYLMFGRALCEQMADTPVMENAA